MPTTFSSVIVREEGTAIIQVSFKDENGVAVIPNPGTIKWTLTDKPVFGEVASVINSLSEQAIDSASTINIVLEGDDLTLLSSEASEAFVERVLTVKYQYDSAIQANLDDVGQLVFKVENLHYIT